MKTNSRREDSESEGYSVTDHTLASTWKRKPYQKIQTAVSSDEDDLVPITSSPVKKNLPLIKDGAFSVSPPIMILKASPPISVEKKSLQNNNIRIHDTDQIKPTYWNLLRYNRPFRLFILCHILTLTGEWFTYVASISLIERKNGPNNPNIRAETGLLLLIWLMPNMLLSAVGGVLADSQDRRKSIIYIELVAAVVTSGYFLAYYYNSLVCVYIVTFFRQSAAALYQPCRYAITQMMVRDDQLLKKATTLSGFVWATMATFGSALGGLTVAKLGIQACFLMDVSTYLASAYIMYRIGGTWKAQPEGVEEAEEDDEEELQGTTHNSLHQPRTSAWQTFCNMAMDGVLYLRSNFFGPLIFLKFSAAIIYGSLTVIQVSVSEIYSVTPLNQMDQNNEMDISNSSALLGILLACTGLGSFIGTSITDRFTDVKSAQSLQLGCVWGFLCMGLAYLVMGTFLSFPIVCICSSLIYVALTIIWIQSDLIFQLYSSSIMMGRVSAVDYALATLSEGLSSFLSGVLEDRFHLSVRRTCFMMALISIIVFVFWFTFHNFGGGAARADPIDDTETESSSFKEEELEFISKLGHFAKD